jgi:hypothetical protein
MHGFLVVHCKTDGSQSSNRVVAKYRNVNLELRHVIYVKVNLELYLQTAGKVEEGPRRFRSRGRQHTQLANNRQARQLV